MNLRERATKRALVGFEVAEMNDTQRAVRLCQFIARNAHLASAVLHLDMMPKEVAAGTMAEIYRRTVLDFEAALGIELPTEAGK